MCTKRKQCRGIREWGVGGGEWEERRITACSSFAPTPHSPLPTPSQYTPRVHPEVQELQTKLKEILYDCAVEIRATKAALYLLTNDARFELITEYGYRGVIRPLADRTDPVVDRCGRGRTPFFINGLNAEPRFSHVMFESASDRLLGAPIYLRGHMVGFIDMRDKAGKVLVDAAYLPKARRISDRIAEQFANRNVFNQRF